MMKGLAAKLKNNAGETLVESLTAILIFTFASIILLSMIATAAKINMTAQQEDDRIAAELNIAEWQKNILEPQPGEDYSIVVEYSGESKTIPVNIYADEEGALYSFGVKEEQNE